jgi:hypothetical protein
MSRNLAYCKLVFKFPLRGNLWGATVGFNGTLIYFQHLTALLTDRQAENVQLRECPFNLVC